MFTKRLPDFLNFINNLQELVCHVADINIRFGNPLQSLTKQNLTTLSFHSFVQVVNIPTRKYSYTVDCFVVRLDGDTHKKSIDRDSLESDHYCIEY